jgi:alkaline phosphatase
MVFFMKRTIAPILTVLLLITSCSFEAKKPPAPKNIILLIGDGMGASQLTAAKYAKGRLEIERCPVGGLVTTHSSDKIVTDSAASGTAMATGYKTSNGTISQTPDGVPLKTALEIAESGGKATGLVCTSAITHATPASFSAHVPKRGMQPEIAEQIAAKEIEVLFGGGLGYFIPQSEENSLRKDDKNVLESLESRMKVITTQEEFEGLEVPERIAGLFADKAMPKASEGRIGLPDMTAKALQILSQNKEGFFLMVEGSQIDWGGHANDAEYVLGETVDFDNAAGVALDFAEKDGNTLVIVTADHETGGFAVLGGSAEDRSITETAFATKKHSAAMVPLFAYGPGAEAFGGILDNTDLGRLIIRNLGASL